MTLSMKRSCNCYENNENNIEIEGDLKIKLLR